MKNRLNLDWALSTAKERTQFLNTYIQSETFSKRPPTEEELETMANYVLWGQDSDGLNSDQRKEIQLPRRNATWSAQNLESLDELLESPTFSESSLYQLGDAAPKKVREVFSRERIRASLNQKELKPFEELWRQIDETELIINFFEEEKGKRKNPPRESLLRRFNEEEQRTLRARSSQLNQFSYLKLRHLLVELRRQQYTLRDCYLPPTIGFAAPAPPPPEETPIQFEDNVPVFPLGVVGEIWFKDFQELIPKSFSEADLKKISTQYWRKKEEEKTSSLYFDFRELEPVYQLFLELEDFQEEEKHKEDDLPSNSKLIDTLWFYVRQADLSDIHRLILELKISKTKNQDIADKINREFGKNYTANYISTIFRQKIIPAINEAAIYHERVVGALFFEEEFKVCSCCGRTLLRDPINFVRRSRAKDGLSNHCKKCDKEERERKKGGIIKENGK